MSFVRSSDRRRRGSRAQQNIIDEEQRYAKFQEQYSHLDKAEKDRKSSREARADPNVRGQLKDFDDKKKYAKFEDEYTRFEKSERAPEKPEYFTGERSRTGPQSDRPRLLSKTPQGASSLLLRKQICASAIRPCATPASNKKYMGSTVWGTRLWFGG